MPKLEQVILATIPDSDQIVDRLGSFAVTDMGTISYMRDNFRTDRRVITTLDSSGRVIARWGRRGERPGEFRGRESLLSSDSFVVAPGIFGIPVRVYTPSGKLILQKPNPPSGVPTAMNDGRIVWWRSTSRTLSATQPFVRGKVYPVVLWCVFEVCERSIVPASDSVLAIIDSAISVSGTGGTPPIVHDSEYLWIADPYSYTIWRWNLAKAVPPVKFGRHLRPRMATPRKIAEEDSFFAMLDRKGIPGPNGVSDAPNAEPYGKFLRTQPRPHFYKYGMSLDEHGRLWVVGNVGDSTFVDVFADTTFVGRMALGCRKESWGHGVVQGHWLVLQCATDSDEQPYELRLYRIVEASTSADSSTNQVR